MRQEEKRRRRGDDEEMRKGGRGEAYPRVESVVVFPSDIGVTVLCFVLLQFFKTLFPGCKSDEREKGNEE